MVRDAVTRKKKYVAGVDGKAVGEKVERQKGSMVEQETAYFGQVVLVEQKAKSVVEAAGVSGFEAAQYLIVARQCLKLSKKFAGATRDNEAASLLVRWAARGLDPGLLSAVCRAGGCDVPEVTPRSLEDILVDIGRLHFKSHSRTRVYPQDVTVAPTLTAAGVADVFGPWAEIVPLDTVPFPFHVVGVCVCSVTAAGNYHIQLGYNTVLADPGANMEMGERRLRIATVPIAKQTELLEIRGQGIPANSRVMGRLKTASGNPDEATVSVVLTRHVEVLRSVELWPGFPW